MKSIRLKLIVLAATIFLLVGCGNAKEPTLVPGDWVISPYFEYGEEKNRVGQVTHLWQEGRT